MIETWEDVIGFEGYYQVSSLGRVKAIARLKKRISYGKQTDFKCKEKILFLAQDMHGYLRIRLMRDRYEERKKVHRLVAEAFIPNPENKPEVNHKNGRKDDNSVSNLEWVTRSENSIHALRTGLQSINRQIAVAQYDFLGNEIKRFKSRAEAYRQTGINASGISGCIAGRLHSAGGFKWGNI